MYTHILHTYDMYITDQLSSEEVGEWDNCLHSLFLFRIFVIYYLLISLKDNTRIKFTPPLYQKVNGYPYNRF